MDDALEGKDDWAMDEALIEVTEQGMCCSHGCVRKGRGTKERPNFCALARVNKGADAKRALAAIQDSGTHVVAPVEPSEKMLSSITPTLDAMMNGVKGVVGEEEIGREVYKAMIAASQEVDNE